MIKKSETFWYPNQIVQVCKTLTKNESDEPTSDITPSPEELTILSDVEDKHGQKNY